MLRETQSWQEKQKQGQERNLSPWHQQTTANAKHIPTPGLIHIKPHASESEICLPHSLPLGTSFHLQQNIEKALQASEPDSKMTQI